MRRGGLSGYSVRMVSNEDLFDLIKKMVSSMDRQVAIIQAMDKRIDKIEARLLKVEGIAGLLK